MPTVQVSGTHLQFYFTDSGAPSTLSDYTTFILIHGHSFHGVFRKLLPLAPAHSVRVICINRREYPGSTPHTAEELAIYASGTEEERNVLVHQAGVHLALAIDGIMQQCALPSAGCVAIAGWSLGNAFVLAAVAAIMDLPAPARERLQSSVKTIIMWDPPSMALGIADPSQAYTPLHDQNLSLAARVPAFGKWVSSYYVHNDLATYDPEQLNYRDADPSRKATFEDMPVKELLTLVDFTVGDKCDTALLEPRFVSVLASSTNKALFDPEIRNVWKDVKIVHLYGQADQWTSLFAVGHMKKRVEEAQGRPPITFRCNEGANHFIMWEDPDFTLKELLECTK
ncbi:AB hydrolase-1 domain-containing protein [Favolaschia claudopus]|uniref:AB hydrolase-1 domain-containing protein n=1 Tax=Favolaschia claudopus TaxID=2862362 RepID=A0AAW0CJ58_9AGAR